MSNEAVEVPFPNTKLLAPEMVASEETPVVVATCGSYNPIHTGHIAMFTEAKAALESGRAKPDAVKGNIRVVGGYLSPVNDGYGKAGLAKAAPRIELCRLALEDNDWISVDQWEALQPAFVRSYVVLSRIFQKTKDEYAAMGPAGEAVAARLRIVFLCGADLFESFYRPGCWELELLRLIFTEMLLLAVCRDGSADPRERMKEAEPLTHEKSPGVTLNMAEFTDNVCVLQALEGKCASSTLVRNHLAAGDSITGLVPTKCEELLLKGDTYPVGAATKP